MSPSWNQFPPTDISKGINLPLSQFATLVEILPQIESILKEKGQTIPRPDYEGGDSEALSTAALKAEAAGQSEAEEDESAEEKTIAIEPSKLDKFKYSKKNHEATSDEED